MRADALWLVVHLRPAQRIAFAIVLERGLVLGLILECLAQGEVEVEAILGAQVVAPKLRAHLLELIRPEAVGFEVRKAPPHLPETPVQLQRPPVRADPLRDLAVGLERVPVTEPDARLARVFLENRDVDLDGARVLTDPGQHRRLEGPVAGIARLGLEQSVDLRQRRGMITLTVQSHGVVLTSAVEVRRELQTPRQQILGVGVAADAGGDLGEHAQRRDIGGMLVQVPPQ